MNKIYYYILTSLILLSLTSCRETETAPPLSEAVEVAFDTAAAVRGTIHQRSLYEAYVKADVQALEFEVRPGTLKKIHVSLGDYVEKGDLIAELDTTQADKTIAEARDRLASLKKKRNYDLEQKQYDIDLETIDLDLLLSDADRYEEAELKKISIKKLEDDYKLISDSTNLEIRQAEKAVRAAEDLLEGTRIYSPVSGEVTYIEQVVPGDRIAIHSPLVYVSDLSNLFVQHSGTESISSQNRVTALIDGEEYPLLPFEYDEREYIAMTIAGNKPPNRFHFESPPTDIEPGVFVALIVYTAERDDVIYIPNNSLYYGSGKSYVYKVEGGEKIYTEIKTGLITGSYVEIISGLEEGDVVYVKQ